MVTYGTAIESCSPGDRLEIHVDPNTCNAYVQKARLVGNKMCPVTSVCFPAVSNMEFCGEHGHPYNKERTPLITTLESRKKP